VNARPVVSPSPSARILLGPLLLTGCGSGLVVGPNTTLALDDIPDRQTGAAACMLQTMQRIGSAFSIAIAGLLFFNTLADSHHDYPAAASKSLIACLTLIDLALLAATTDLLLGRRQPRPAPNPQRP
jgi:hypothetical protein